MRLFRTTLVLVVSLSARAATFNVNSTADLPDAAGGDGVCSTGHSMANGQPECTLRAAVDEANALAGADTIAVPSGTYNLSTPSLCKYRDHNDANPFQTTSRTLCLSGDTSITGSGAASTIIDGMAADRVFFISDGATVTISGVTVQNGRHSGSSFDGRGAGINNQGTLTIVDSIVSLNSADGAGGGIHTAGSLVIRRSSISNNAGLGVGGDGGGIWVFAGSLVVSESTFDGNAAVNGGGGIAMYTGTATITGSTFSNNTAGVGGGGLRLYNDSIAYVSNSTFAGNSTSNAGGGIRNDTGTVYLNNVTVARNTATGFAGAGVYGTMHMRNSIVSENTSINPQFFAGADCLEIAPNAIISEGYNLIQDARNCNITGDTSGNITGQDALLGALALNGGSTATVAMLQSSPAIDAGSPLVAGSGGNACAAIDQRSTLRPQGARCDMGAFERNGGFVVSKVTPTRGGNAGSAVVIVSGSGFADGAGVRLRRSGQPDIAGSPATVEPGGFSMASSLDLTAAGVGAWDIVVGNADGSTSTLPGAFAVESPQAPDLWSYVVGRSAIRPGVPVKYTIVYGNRGNVAALAVPLTLSMPGGFETSIYFPVTPPPAQPGQVATDWSIAPLAVWPYSPQGELTVPLLIPVIPAGFSSALDFSLRLPPTLVHGDTFTFSTTFGTSFLTPATEPAALQDMVDGAVGYAKDLGVIVPAEELPAIRAYAVNQLESIVSPARDALVATLSTGTPVYSLAQMNIDAGRYAAAQTTGPSVMANGNFKTLANSSVPKNNCSGRILREGESCDSSANPVPPPDDPVKPNPKGIIPSDCGNAIPGHHLNQDKTLCKPNDMKDCPNGIGSAFSTDPRCRIYPVLSSIDPNEKTGPRGGANVTAQKSGIALGYGIHFENKATASGAAQAVVVTDQLDTSKVDLGTFALGPLSFGTFTVVPPPGQTSYATILDMRPAQNFLVKMEAALNMSTGLATWGFATLDPLTAQITDDPMVGFLPPNTDAPNGEGQVAFTVQPKLPIATGTAVCNLASIVFDFNAPIVTNQWCNTMDDVAPVSHVQGLGAQSSSPFTVQWSGSDIGSAIVDYDIYVSDNGGTFVRWLQQTDLNESPYVGVAGHSYSFFSLARDQAGNAESGKTTAEATTSVTSSCPADVTVQFNIVPGGFRRDNASGNYVQTVTATTKSGSPAPQGLRFVLDGLPSNVSLANQMGTTVCAAPIGSPFLTFSPTEATSSSDSGVLQFRNPGDVAIRYTLRLIEPGAQP